ncbi:molybdenum cofactor biosynthesis protein A, partial [Opisthorchis viverrini]
MTTNGIAFAKRAKQFKELGLDSVNISLDSLKPERVKQLTGSPVLKHAYTSIYSALGSGYNPVKLNCVVIRGFNDDEICDFVGLTKHLPIELRFIEFMPFGGNNWDTEKLVSYKEMLNTIRKVYPDLYPLPVPFSNTAKLYRVNDWPGTVGFITSMTENFCSNCSRLRLTADGHLKTCLHGEEEVDLIKVIQQYPLEAADWKDSAVSLFHSQVPQTKLEMVLASLDEKVDIALARKAPEHA